MFLFPQWRYFTFYSIVNVPWTFPSFCSRGIRNTSRGEAAYSMKDWWGASVLCLHFSNAIQNVFNWKSLKSAPRKGCPVSIDASIKTRDEAIHLHLHFIGQRYCLGKWAPCELNEENKQEKKSITCTDINREREDIFTESYKLIATLPLRNKTIK